MRCYLCNGDVDVALMSGVPVCLHCRRREQVYADMTTPEQRAENSAFMRQFGEPHTMQLRHVASERDVVGEWKRLCEQLLSRDATAHAATMAPPTAKVSADNPKRIDFSMAVTDYEARAAIARVYAWAALLGIEQRPTETFEQLEVRVLAKIHEPLRSPWGDARFGTQKDKS